MKFNVGDRVRVVSRTDHDLDWVRVGEEFVIADFDRANSHPYRVEACGDYDWLKGDQLERASAENFQQLTANAPQVYKLQVPEEPAGVDRVRPVEFPNVVWERSVVGGRWRLGEMEREWRVLLAGYPEGVESVPAESDFEVSLDYLRRNPHVLDGLEASGVTGSHAAAVVRGVLAKEEWST